MVIRSSHLATVSNITRRDGKRKPVLTLTLLKFGLIPSIRKFLRILQGQVDYDSYQTAAWFYGDFFTSDQPAIVEIAPFLKDPKYPYWNAEQFLPSMRRLYTWQDKLYGVLLDADAQILYYRKDVLGNANYQEKFKGELGYDLPNPPKTMQEMHDVASFFTGWDWNGDGKDNWGISLHAKTNEQGFFHFLTLAAPYVISPSNKSVLLLQSGGYEASDQVRGASSGLGRLCEVLARRPKGADQLDPGTGLEHVRAGHAVMEPTSAICPLAQDRAARGARPGRSNDYSRNNGDLQSVDQSMGKKLAQCCREYQWRELALCDFAAVQAERGD